MALRSCVASTSTPRSCGQWHGGLPHILTSHSWHMAACLYAKPCGAPLTLKATKESGSGPAVSSSSFTCSPSLYVPTSCTCTQLSSRAAACAFTAAAPGSSDEAWMKAMGVEDREPLQVLARC